MKWLTSRRRDLVTELLGQGIWESAKTIIGILILGTVSFGIGNIASLAVDWLSPYRWYVAILSGLIVVWLAIAVHLRRSRSRPKFPPIESEFEVLEREVTYEYLERWRMHYKKRVVLKALRGGLDKYVDKYLWSGHGTVTIRSAIAEHDFRQTSRRNLWQFYEIQLGRTLGKGDEIETELIWELDDATKSSQPFMSAVVEEPTRLLTMTLILPPALNVKQVTCEVAPELGGKVVSESAIKTLDRNGHVSWSIPEPKLLHAYEMKWRFNSE